MTSCEESRNETACQSTNRRRKVIAWLMVGAWMAVIFLLSNEPHSSQETERILGVFNVIGRKIGHVSEYAALFILLRRAWGLTWERGAIGSFPCLAAFVVSFLYSWSDEWHQSFVPGRSASLADVAVDSFGVFLGLALFLVISRITSGLIARRPLGH